MNKNEAEETITAAERKIREIEKEIHSQFINKTVKYDNKMFVIAFIYYGDDGRFCFQAENGQQLDIDDLVE